MGTSKSNPGPGKTPLLPEWYNPDLPNEDESGDNSADDKESSEDGGANDTTEDNQAPSDVINSWRGPKTALTKYLGNQSAAKLRTAARSYVRNYGGSKRAASTVISGIGVGRNFVSFLQATGRDGLKQAASQVGVDSIDGLPAKQLFVVIANSLAKGVDTAESSVARAAIIDTMCDIYKQLEDEGKSIEELNNITNDKLNEYTVEYLSNYIYHRWLQELGIQIETKSIGETDLIKVESEMKAFINTSLKLNWKKFNLKAEDFNSSKGKKVITKVFEQAYYIIESL